MAQISIYAEELSEMHESILADEASEEVCHQRSRKEGVDILTENIPIEKIVPKHILRTEPVPEPKELAHSIDELGMLEPICVRPVGDQYEIIYGYRRYLASLSLGVKYINCIVRDAGDGPALAMALAENVHRDGLSAIEKGNAVQALFNEYGISADGPDLIKELNHIADFQAGKVQKLRTRCGEIAEVVKLLGVTPRTVRQWLEATQISEHIKEDEISAPDAEKLPDKTLARIGTLADEDVQEKVYARVKKDELGAAAASQLVTKVKKAVPEDVEKVLEKQIEERSWKIWEIPLKLAIDTLNDILVTIDTGKMDPESAELVMDKMGEILAKHNIILDKLTKIGAGLLHIKSGSESPKLGKSKYDWSDCDLVETPAHAELMDRITDLYIEEGRQEFKFTSENAHWLMHNFLADMRKTKMQQTAMFILQAAHNAAYACGALK